MPVNSSKAEEVWLRYQFLRDNGHLEYLKKAEKCEKFFVGQQWEAGDLALLRSQRRPALTINKIISTMSNVMGEQIFNRTEISYQPRNSGATAEVADALSKVYMQISDNNQLPWVRSDVFADGAITSRGFYDVRLDFSDSLKGEVRIEQVNPKNVLIDGDATEYDPDKWADVTVSKWMSPDQIEMLYSKEDAEYLRTKQDSYYPYGYDSIDTNRDRFGTQNAVTYGQSTAANMSIVRNIRVIERQWRKLDQVKHFVDVTSGDMVIIPYEWDNNRISEYLAQNPNIAVTKKLIHRIRWTTIADNVVLHDDWSPYKHFTIVPFFPYFRRGETVGLVENLLGPQELLNKVSSQELHVVNTTANSGWKIKRNALQNMSVAELEQKGAQTGLVLELDEIDNADKITPNPTPSGLDRISYKAEEHIKTISGVSDYQTGNPREDVSAKAVQANRSSGQSNLAKIMDSLQRTDHILARNILDCVQEFYTEERLLHITKDRITREQMQLVVNQVTPEGQISNDLSLGEYGVVVSNVPERDTFEDSQFDQAIALREAGVQIPDTVIVNASRMKDKAEVIKQMVGDKDSPEAQQQAALKSRAQEAEVQSLEADALQKRSAADASAAKAKRDLAESTGAGSKAELEFQAKMEQIDKEHQLKVKELEFEMDMEMRKLDFEMKLQEKKLMMETAIKARLADDQGKAARVAAANQPAQPAAQQGVK